MKINTHLLPIKAHYFFFWGGLAGVMPFLTVVGKDLGMSASLVGMVTTFFPFLCLVAKPLIGSLVDRFQKLKLVLVVLLLLTAVSYFGINFIPKASPIPVNSVLLCAPNGGSEFALNRQASNSCIADLEGNFGNITVNLRCAECELVNGTGRADFADILVEELTCSETSQNFNFTLDSYIKRTSVNIWFPIEELSSDPPAQCDVPKKYKCQMKTSPKQLESCYITVAKETNFWLFIVLFILCRTGTSVLISLSDTACFELLEGQYHLYGKQRLWGALGWGIFSLLVGYLMEIATTSYSTDGKTVYSPGFYTLAISMTISAIIISISDMKNPQASGKIAKNVGKLLKNVEVIVFLFGVLAMGILTGIFWNFYFWYLSDLGAQSLLMALSLVMQCFLGELPFFFIAGWIIGKIGNKHAMSVALGAFGLRFLAYSFLTKATVYYTLPIELLQGLTFGLFYTLMASYGKAIAPVGTEATIQGLVGGMFEGLGLALGGLLGGQGFYYLKGKTTFQVTSVFAFACCVLHIIADFAIRMRAKNQSGDAGNYILLGASRKRYYWRYYGGVSNDYSYEGSIPGGPTANNVEEETSFLKNLNSPNDETQSA